MSAGIFHQKKANSAKHLVNSMRGNPKVSPDSSFNWTGEQPEPPLSGRITPFAEK
jgi:hypothetical protein